MKNKYKLLIVVSGVLFLWIVNYIRNSSYREGVKDGREQMEILINKSKQELRDLGICEWPKAYAKSKGC